MRLLRALTVCLFLAQGLGAEAWQKPPRSHKRTASAGASSPPRRCPHAEGDAAPAGQDTFGSLRARARAEGTVKVIVRLCLPFRPEGELSDAAARRQRARISRAQAELTRALRDFKISAVRRYEFTPFVSMSVDDAALLRLRRLAVVAEVSEDATFAPAQE